MLLYQGPYLTITYENQNSLFKQFWTSSPINIDAFKSELRIYISLFTQYKPQQVIWLQENMAIFINDEVKLWIEQEINIPAFNQNCLIPNEEGFMPVAFVVGKDLLSHLEVLEVFEGKQTSCIRPKHFATEQEAQDWLNKNVTPTPSGRIPEITLKEVDEDGNTIIQIKSAATDIESTLKLIKKLSAENTFLKNNTKLYERLTTREKEILTSYSNGKKHKEMADDLHISIHTFRTHWRNIKAKLNITSNKEAFLFAKAFNQKYTQY